MLNTVARAFEVLSLFTPSQPIWGASRLATRLGVPKSSAHDLLRSLWQLGLLEHRPGGEYGLGLGLLTLSHGVRAAHPWLEVSRREMALLAGQTGEVVHLSVLQGDSLLLLEDVHPGNDGQPESYGRPGGEAATLGLPSPGPAESGVPLQCSAMGKVLLSARPWSEVQALMARQGLPGLTEGSIRTADELQTELERIGRQGYAYDIEEAFPGVCCVAVPVRAGGQVRAAISISVPAERFYTHKRQRRAQLLETGTRLEAALSIPRTGEP
ncbi:IclR family transcriptional regulator [Deinococcus altitudinis]|uniref:IclR family transcriptional regulator n=1 Tax=Deinococcus altitudinis TaxID=468914 RepID=UPI0038914BA3